MCSSLQRLKKGREQTPGKEDAIDFGFNVAICLLEKGQIITQRDSQYGYKLVPNQAYGDAKFRIAVVNKKGKILSYTSLKTDQLMAKNWRVMEVANNMS